MFERKMIARWGDVDLNGHMRNTSYLEKATDIRLMFQTELGFTLSEYARLKVGPVAMKDEVEYHREVRLMEEIKVTLSVAGRSTDGSRWLLRTDIYRADGKLAARITSSGGYLDLTTRKLISPPAEIRALADRLPKTDDFQLLPSSVK